MHLKTITGNFLSCQKMWGLSDFEAKIVGGFPESYSIETLELGFKDISTLEISKEQKLRLEIIFDIACMLDAVIKSNKGAEVTAIEVIELLSVDGRTYREMLTSGRLGDLKELYSMLSTIN